MSIEVPKVLKMQQADSLFTSMSSEKKDFVTKDEFLAYFNKDEVGKYLWNEYTYDNIFQMLDSGLVPGGPLFFYKPWKHERLSSNALFDIYLLLIVICYKH